VVAAYTNDAYLRDAYRCLQVSHRGLWKPNCGGSGSGQNLLGMISLGGQGKVAGRRVQTAGLTLLGHSRLLLRPKPAVRRGKMPGLNLASEKERTNYSIRRAV